MSQGDEKDYDMIVVWKAAVDHREKANLPIIGISRDANVNPTRKDCHGKAKPRCRSTVRNSHGYHTAVNFPTVTVVSVIPQNGSIRNILKPEKVKSLDRIMWIRSGRRKRQSHND